MHGVGLVDLDPAHVARVCVLVVRAAEPDRRLRHRRAAAANALERDTDVVDMCQRVRLALVANAIVRDVQSAAPAVARARRDRRHRPGPAQLGGGRRDLGAPHGDAELLIREAAIVMRLG